MFWHKEQTIVLFVSVQEVALSVAGGECCSEGRMLHCLLQGEDVAVGGGCCPVCCSGKVAIDLIGVVQQANCPIWRHSITLIISLKASLFSHQLVVII